MAPPLTDTVLLDTLRAALGSRLREANGYDSARNRTVTWRDHDRNPVNSAWGPLHGVMVHHTGSNTSGNGQSYNQNVLWSGYAGLPGPLCHFGVAPDGTAWLNSNGRANHAGGGDPAVLAKVIAETYDVLRPTKGNANGVDGNRHFYGIEVMYSGGGPMTAAQWETTTIICAALATRHSWTSRSVIGHREWSRDKWDPGATNMDELRRDVQLRMGAAGDPTPEKDWFDMATENELRKIIREEVRKGTPRAPMKSHASLDGGVIEENVAGAIRRLQTIGRQNRSKLNEVNKKLDRVITALSDRPQAASGISPAVFDIQEALAQVELQDRVQEQAGEATEEEDQ